MDAVSTRLRHGLMRKFKGALSRAEALGKDELKHKYFVLQSYSMIPKLSIYQIIYILLLVCASRECGEEDGVLLESTSHSETGRRGRANTKVDEKHKLHNAGKF